MSKYILCPRCELNYIRDGEKNCNVCKAEMNISGYTLLPDDENAFVEEFRLIRTEREHRERVKQRLSDRQCYGGL
jgi:hypothetical protein